MKDCGLRDSHDSAASASRRFKRGDLLAWLWGLVNAMHPFPVGEELLVNVVEPFFGAKRRSFGRRRIKSAIARIVDLGIFERHGTLIALKRKK